MNTGKMYRASNGDECSVWQIVKREPEWAATRLQLGEDAIDRVAALESDLAEARKREQRLTTIADENFGPFPVQDAESNMTAIEQGIYELRLNLALARKLIEEWKPIVAPYLQRDKARQAMRERMRDVFPQYLSEVWYGNEILCLNVLVYDVPENCVESVANAIYDIGELISKDIIFLAMCKTPEVTATYYSERVTELRNKLPTAPEVNRRRKHE